MTERGETPPPFTQTGNGANTLVFIHGFLDDSSFWQPTIQALEARNLSAVTIDLPGMGQAADDPGPFSLDRLAQAVASVIGAAGRSTVLVGHSMGAQVAELVARMRPRQVSDAELFANRSALFANPALACVVDLYPPCHRAMCSAWVRR